MWEEFVDSNPALWYSALSCIPVKVNGDIKMTKRFCTQCGAERPAGSSFCPKCGAAQNTGAQQSYPTAVQQIPNQQHYQQYRTAQPAYRQPYQAAPPIGCNTPQVTSAKATGLIVGVFMLIVAFLLIVLILILPSKEDFSLMGSTEGPQVSASSASPAPSADAAASEEEYGEVPLSVVANVNVDARAGDYAGSYTGTVSFRNKNLYIMSELFGDTSYEDILSGYNGNTYDCTAEIDDCIRLFSPDVYSENDDGSSYVYYYFGSDLENGIAVYEDSNYDEELQCRYSMADKAYFLTDGSVYVINITMVEFDDGRIMASEIRMKLTPVR